VSSIRGAFVGALSSFHLPFLRGGQGGVSYEEFKALDDVSFEVKKGEFFGIIGRNGSGKSTLLKVLAGIYEADKGKVKIDGMISPFLELGIGFNPELSGRDNVYLNATVLGMTKKQIDEKFDAIVAFSELERFIDQKLKNYSSGMQVRLAFSVSIHANRDILLMDEVLAVGDSNFQSKCLTEFMKYKKLGKTVILVTHDIGTVQRYCDRVLLLRNGKVVMVSGAEEVGSAYLHENMSDEEKRIREERVRAGETKSEITSSAEKTAEISAVDFLDDKGNEKNVYQTGEDIRVRVNFRTNKDCGNVNFGIAIYSQEEVYMFGVNTLAQEFDGKKYIEQGYFEFEFKQVPLRTNTYYIKAGIWGEVENSLYDFLERSSSFKIFSVDNNQGNVSIEYQLR
jgi:ABC-type polysaccharide/polyol phosphate transport system ATPase subunit